ncbi:MAG: sigma-54-dependent Fis family transcriptional regulator [Phycisphaeraceae bacterium]|nr:sigma-54-dependent Fis family transcriptional regulator [Phycisphaeraceae bacterium]
MSSPLIAESDQPIAQAVQALVYCNPFTPQRVEYECQALGKPVPAARQVWSHRDDHDSDTGHVLTALRRRVEPMVDRLQRQLTSSKRATYDESELLTYEALAIYLLYDLHHEALSLAAQAALTGRPSPAPHAVWPAFLRDFQRYFVIPGRTMPGGHRPEHLFAVFFQIRRAFTHIFEHIVGASQPAAQLRAAVWQSIFTHDLSRYYRFLFDRMGEFTTLITGESGTGKELVARAIGLSRYVAFDPKSQRFAGDFVAAFYPVNLAALSPTLIESELFGHKRGSFTGAVEDRVGWLESCPDLGAVFLDEIGELEPTLQVKLLRVLQDRRFSRIGETRSRAFAGKIIAATNRDMATEIHQRRFRQDLYYRLCSDVIRTPSLREQLRDRPGDLDAMIMFITRRISPRQPQTLCRDAAAWIRQGLGETYDWPGNFRELEQCVRNVMVRGSYEPLANQTQSQRDPMQRLLDDVRHLRLDADSLLSRYAAMVHDREGSYEAAARRLGLDRRTVKARAAAGRNAMR